MVVRGLVIAKIAPRRPLRWVIVGFGLCCGTLAATAALPAGGFALATICWTVSGVTYVAGNAPFISLLQSTIAHHLQGRVLSLLHTLLGLAAPVGLVLASPTGEILGIRALMVMAGVGGALVCALAATSPALRAALRRESAAPSAPAVSVGQEPS